jgi:hypothetical protein
MGIRKPEELDSAVATLRKNLREYDEADYPEDNSAYTLAVDQKAVRVVLDAVQPQAEQDFLIRLLTEAGQHPANLTVLASGVLHGLRAMGWQGPNEQETNPPKPYDSDAEELSGHPVRKVDRVPAAAQCTDYQNAAEMRTRCTMTLGHRGPTHYSLDEGVSWPVGTTPDGHLCAGFRTTAGLVLRCGLDAGHTGDHRDNGAMGTWI